MAAPMTICENFSLTVIFTSSNATLPPIHCIPDAAHMLHGDFEETVPGALARIGAPAALIHGDIGSADTARDAELAAWLGPALRPLAAPGAVILSDRALGAAIWPPEPLPRDVAPGVYFMYRAVARS